jgi:hypothetical protein
MFLLRSSIYPILCAVVMAGTLACDTKTSTTPTSPPVPGAATAIVVGTVLNTQTRQPISGAMVTMSTQPIAPAMPSATTAVDGSFRIESVVMGMRTVRVEAEGYQSYTQELNVGGSEVRADITLIPDTPPPPPPVLTTMGGLVTTRQTSLPVNNATVTFTLQTGERFTATTGIDGQFQMSGVPVGAVGDLRVTANGHRAEDQRVTVEPNLFVTVGLDQG